MELASVKIAHVSEERLSRIAISAIKIIMYFDIFDYPLAAAEIFDNLDATGFTPANVQVELEELVASKQLSNGGGFYCLPGREKILPERPRLNERAAKFWPVGRKMSSLISYFPFVEAVLITGSLSKNCMYDTGDIDYMIITKPGRLWLCRALLTAFKKLALLNSRKYFCLNYYIDTDTLKIPDENIFTATEIVYARPTYNYEVCDHFFASNNWAQNFYLNRPSPDLSWAAAPNKSFIKAFAEKLLGGWLGEKADGLFFRMFVAKWKKKFGNQDGAAFEINFRSRKNVSKHHPSGFQVKVLLEYEKRVNEFKRQHGGDWN